ncbi:tRNA (guanine(46)-N(7))-methyltransferase [hydrothermal vent metagenome]|uniref:tRNA (guanine(46)-N(7))-methyltransferase n=1 Tax=hydrothermal vent metagenome TaxID=652676 RepID=A0A3B0YMI5_9ZZZZ
MSKFPILRKIRTFVKREGRLTPGQEKALSELWPQWGLNFDGANPVLPEDDFFRQNSQRYLDIGFGNGETIEEMALLNPDKQFIGIEVHRPGVGSLLHRMQQNHLSNIRLLNYDAVQIIESELFDFQFDGIYLLFADPWPKRKHIKRRMVQAEFVQKVTRLIKPGGYFYIATDWNDYAKHIRHVMQGQTQFNFESNITSAAETIIKEGPHIIKSSAAVAETNIKTDNSQVKPHDKVSSLMAEDVIIRPNSKYERRGQKLGHKIHDMLYRLKT